MEGVKGAREVWPQAETGIVTFLKYDINCIDINLSPKAEDSEFRQKGQVSEAVGHGGVGTLSDQGIRPLTTASKTIYKLTFFGRHDLESLMK